MRSTRKRVAMVMGVFAAAVLAVFFAYWEQFWAWYLRYQFDQIGAVVVDDYDPVNKDPNGRLRAITRAGILQWTHGGLSRLGDTCPRLGVGVALDPELSRVYVLEWGKKQLLALDSTGGVLFKGDYDNAEALAVDPNTGEIWCVGSEGRGLARTTVFAPSGREVASYSSGGTDIAYNRFDGSFWILGNEIMKVDRNRSWSKIALLGGTCWRLALDPRDGSMWVTEVSPLGRAGRLLRLDSHGKLVRMIQFPGSSSLRVACDPKTGTAWVADSSGSVKRIPVEGEALPPLPFPAEDVTFSERTETVWLATGKKIIVLKPTGEVLAEYPIVSPGVLWIAAP